MQHIESKQKKAITFLKLACATTAVSVACFSHGQVPLGLYNDPDINDDNWVNFLDYSILTDCYGTEPLPGSSNPCLSSDFNADGSVNFLDINIFKDRLFNRYPTTQEASELFSTPYTVDVAAGFNDSGFEDLNGDGVLDYYTIKKIEPNEFIWVYSGNGDGSFQEATQTNLLTHLTSNWSAEWSLGDFNGDGLKDLIATHINTATFEKIFVFPNNNGTFGQPIDVSDNFPHIGTNRPSFYNGRTIIADTNSDGNDDIVIAFTNFNFPSFDNNTIHSLLSDGGYNFSLTQTFVEFSPPQGNIWYESYPAFHVEDITGDGIADIRVTHTPLVSPPAPEVWIVSREFVTGQGDGTFDVEAIDLNLEDSETRSFQALFTDTNNDGVQDLVLGPLYVAQFDFGSNFITIATYDKLRNFTVQPCGQNVTAYRGTTEPKLRVGDLNNDGYTDVVTQAERYIDGAFVQQLQISLGNGDGGCQAPTEINLPENTNTSLQSMFSLHLVDLNEDGKLDIAGYRIGGQLLIYLQN